MTIQQTAQISLSIGNQDLIALIGFHPESVRLTQKRKELSELQVSFKAISDTRKIPAAVKTDARMAFKFELLPDALGDRGRRRNRQTLTGTYLVQQVTTSYDTDGSIKLSITAKDGSIGLSKRSKQKPYAGKLSDVLQKIGEDSAIIFNTVQVSAKALATNVTVGVGPGKTLGTELGSALGDLGLEMHGDDNALNVIHVVPWPTVETAAPRGRTWRLSWRERSGAMLSGIYVHQFTVTEDAQGKAGGTARKVSTTAEDGEQKDASDKRGNDSEVIVNFPGQGSYTALVDLGTTVSSYFSGRDQDRADAKAKSSAQKIRATTRKATGKVSGVLMRPRQFVFVSGLNDRHERAWFLDSVTTNWQGGDLTQTFELLSDAPKKATPKKAADQDGDGKPDGVSGAENEVIVNFPERGRYNALVDGLGNVAGKNAPR